MFTLSADSSFLVTRVDVAFGTPGGAQPELDLSIASPGSGVDIHANPLSFTINFLDPTFSSILPPPGHTVDVPVCARVFDNNGVFVPLICPNPPGNCALAGQTPAQSVCSPDLTLLNDSIFATSPAACMSQDTCTLKVQSTFDVSLIKFSLLLCKKGTQICDLVTGDFSSAPVDLKNGVSPSFIFNNIDPNGLVVPPCSGSVTITPIWNLTLSTGIVSVTGPDFILTSGNCTQVVMEKVSTTQDVIGPCVGVRGVVGVDGVLDTVGALGLLTTFENQPVHFGLIDPATGTFYEYVLSNTSVTSGLSPGGRFGASFGIENRADVAALIPPSGTRSMQLAAIYEGDDTHSPVMSTKQITVQGENVTSPCFSGTLIAQKIYSSLPTNVTEVHQLITVFTTSIIPANLESQAQALLDKTATAITTSGATPLDVFIYRGPDVPILTIFGLTVGTVPTLIVLAHAFGSPVAPLLIVLAIVAALIALGILVYVISQQWANIAKSAFQFCQQNPQLCAAAINTAQILAVAAVIGVAGVVGFFAYREIRKGGGLRGLRG